MTDRNGRASFETTIPKAVTLGQGLAAVLVTSDEFGSVDDRTVITIPNGRLADMRIESLAPRDRIRLSTTIGLAPTTTEPQLRNVLAGMEHVLRTHPRIWPESVAVRLAAFGSTSFEIEVLCWFATDDYDVFRDCRQVPADSDWFDEVRRAAALLPIQGGTRARDR